MTISPSLDKRLSAITRNHDLMHRNGVVYCVGDDGLVRALPREVRRPFPLTWLFIALFVFIITKTMMVSYFGAVEYAEHLYVLHAGSMIEQAVAFVMQPDRVTTALAAAGETFLAQL